MEGVPLAAPITVVCHCNGCSPEQRFSPATPPRNQIPRLGRVGTCLLPGSWVRNGASRTTSVLCASLKRRLQCSWGGIDSWWEMGSKIGFAGGIWVSSPCPLGLSDPPLPQPQDTWMGNQKLTVGGWLSCPPEHRHWRPASSGAQGPHGTDMPAAAWGLRARPPGARGGVPCRSLLAPIPVTASVGQRAPR